MARLYVFSICLSLCALQAYAADTIETWDAGAANFEVYTGLGGVGAAQSEQSFTGNAVMGWGVAERFSAFMATSFEADGFLADSEAVLEIGAFGTPLDSDHVDLDLGLHLKMAGPGLGEAILAPFWELNLDHTAGIDSYGLYLRGMVEIFGAQTEEGAPFRSADLDLIMGAYYCLSPRQQLLVEYEGVAHQDPAPGGPDWETGTVHLGYNALLNDNLELITEVNFALPDDDGNSAVGFFVGIIATLAK